MRAHKISLAVLLILWASAALAQNKAADFSNAAIGREPAAIKVADPATYYFNRLQAIELVKNRDWLSAKPLLVKLTSGFKDDGDTWLALAITHFELKEWQQAVAAFKRALALGSQLHGLPGHGENPNDMMIRLAEAYAQAGDEQQAMHWINQALTARWDDRPKLAGTSFFQQGKNPNFSAFENTEAFERAAGSYLEKGIRRDEGWRHDLKYLASEIKRLHVHPFHAISEKEFEKRINDIHRRIPELSDQQVVFNLMQLLGSLGNGHNFIIPAFGEKGSFTQLPMQFYWFSDGLYVVGASDAYKRWIGSRVEKVGDTPVLEALERLKAVNPRDNEMQQRWLAPFYLSLAPVLEGLGIVKSAETIHLTLSDGKGERYVVTPDVERMSFSGFPKLPGLTTERSPRYLQHNTDNYWLEALPGKLLYVQVNDIKDKSTESIQQFSQRIQQRMTQRQVDNMVLDLRHNSGGDGSLNAPLIASIVLFNALKPEGKLFVLIGRNTFSAAHNLLVNINELTNAVLVGEPSGSSVNALSEAGWFNLPYSKQTGLISSQFHQAGEPEDHRIWIAPHVPVDLSAKQYFAGKDPAMSAVMAILKRTN